MSIDPAGETDWAGRWDRLYEALAAEPRRMIIISLADAPPDRRLPLPDAAESPNQALEADSLRLLLRHRHLPMLADAGYVRWEREPFCVQRGSYFEEVAFVVNKVLESVDEIPQSLIDNCRILPEIADDDD